MLKSCLSIYKDEPKNALPVQLLSFAHHIRKLRDVVLEFKEHSGTMTALKKVLSSVGICKIVQQLIAKDPEHLSYSGLVTLLASKASII